MVSPQVPLVLHLLLADLTGKLPADGVHVEDVLLQVELVAEHALAVLTHPRLPALPGGTQEGSHLFGAKKSRHLVGCRDAVNVEQVQGGRGRCGRRLLLEGGEEGEGGGWRACWR